MQARLNIFLAWFFMPQTIVMGWIAAVGGSVLQVLGSPVTEGDIPSRLMGAVLLFAALYLVWHFRGGNLPPEGKPEGNGYRFGHKLVLAGNVMAACLFVYQFFEPSIDSHNLHLVLTKFTNAFGYLCMGFFAVGFSLLYQSSLPQESQS